MGKIEGQGRNQRTQEQDSRSSLNCCCFTTGIRRIAKAFSFRCLLFLILGAGVSLSAILWLPPFRSMHSGFDATDADKLGALVQASFTLQKPVSMLVAHTARLEQEIFDEIGVREYSSASIPHGGGGVVLASFHPPTCVFHCGVDKPSKSL